MGLLYYDNVEEPIQIDDLTLAHLKVMIATKLRRNESFTLSWRHPEGEPAGRSTIWLHPSIPLRFVFNEPVAPPLKPEWITAMANSANTSGGITLLTADMMAQQERPSGASDAGALSGPGS